LNMAASGASGVGQVGSARVFVSVKTVLGGHSTFEIFDKLDRPIIAVRRPSFVGEHTTCLMANRRPRYIVGWTPQVRPRETQEDDHRRLN
jgi:hypothetical protein